MTIKKPPRLKIYKSKNVMNLLLSLIIIVICIAGLLHTVFGTWTRFAGEAAKFFPRFVYVLLLISASVILLWEALGKFSAEPPALKDLKWYYPLVFTALGALFFLGAYYIGTMVFVFLFLAGMIHLFSPDPKKEWKKNLLIAAGATVVIWLVFTRVIPMLTPSQILI